MKLNKNEQNYLLTILFKSYILQSVICSGIILVCTVSLDMGLTWVLDRYVEHYYLIYRGLYVYMVSLFHHLQLKFFHSLSTLLFILLSNGFTALLGINHI